MKISEKILKLRKQAGISQEELAEQLQVSRQAISRWEVGSATPDAANIQQLSKLFHVTTDYLLNDDFESDRDIPAVKEIEAKGTQKMKQMIALCVSALGFLGNALIYLLSRMIRVPVPKIYYENGTKMYEWNAARTGYSYIYFIQAHHLEVIAILCGVLFIAGLVYLILHTKGFKK